MSVPALTVLLPVYNGERFLPEAIESILGQSFSDFEFIVINDGSRDRSGDIISRYAKRDRRIRVFEQDNRGLVATLNRGIELARAPLIARMDADDISLPRRFELQLERFATQAKLAVVGGFVNIVDQAGRFVRLGDYPVGGEELRRFLLDGAPLAHPTVIMRRNVLATVGGYRGIYQHAEDYDLWLRIHSAGYEIENVPSPVLNYRQHVESVSLRHSRQQRLATLVARLAYRARAAGLPDPTDAIDAIDETTIDLFPAVLRRDIDAELFVLKHNILSLADLPTIVQAVQDYGALPKEARRDPQYAHFILRAARGFWAHRRYRAALAQLLHALARHPAIAAHLLQGKMRRLGSNLLLRNGN
jgi:glycosyltransferase involved in cell wall biosynthesis